LQLCNGLSALDAGLIGFRAFRVYLGCFAVVAVREAAARARRKTGRRGDVNNRYCAAELERLLAATGPGAVRSDLRRLARVGLVSFGKGAIRFAETPLGFARPLIEEVAGGRSELRPIPVPRSVLRFLARCRKPALTRTMMAYLLRGPSFDKRTGEVKGKGTVKLSWVSRTFGVSERAARYARGELVRLGWIARDRGSFQRKLNRDGAYFEIDLSWECPLMGGELTGPCRQRQHGRVPDGRQGTKQTESAPRHAESRGQFAPPRERPKTPYGSKNQRTRCAEPAGVSSKRTGGVPTIRDVKPADLASFSRTEELYWQAVDRGLIEHSENSALNWLSAAVRAKSVQGDPVRVFLGIIRGKLWSHVTGEQEERARQALVRYREREPFRFRERLPARGSHACWGAWIDR
jgi:hypothetical protein